MSRDKRKKARKARRAHERAHPKPMTPRTETRDPRTRWTNLSARGGLTLSFRPVGDPIPVDLDDPAAPFALHLAAVRRAEEDGES
jgi:hypothetical protein